MVHLNVRSLLSNFDEIKYCFLDGAFDIVALTETWLHSQCSNSLIEVKGYQLFRHDRKVLTTQGRCKRGGGICLYVKDTFKVTLWPGLNISNPDLESYHISCKYGNSKKLNVSVVYRPPAGKLQAAIDVLSDNLTEIQSKVSGDTIVLGDLNVDLLTGNNQAAKLHQFSVSKRLSQLIYCPTRITHATETLIDHIYSDITHIWDSGAIDVNISDHRPVYLIKKKTRNAIKYKELRCRSYKNFDKVKFFADLQSIDFFDVMVSSNPEKCWSMLYERIVNLVNKYCPMEIWNIPIKKPEYK